MNISEEQLSTWAKAPSETEQTKCQNAVSQVTDAIRQRFGDRVSIFLQGSYRNHTNIKVDSDVDIVVRHNDYYFPSVDSLSAQDKNAYWSSFLPSGYTFSQFKNDVEQALITKFGADSTTRNNKCLTVSGNTYRVNADVVPCFVHKRMRTPEIVSAEGIEFVSDSGTRIFSFPVQHYENGTSKHASTDYKYKDIVRILKHVRNQLIDGGKMEEDAMPSFFLECLVWNVLPDAHFRKGSYLDTSRAIIATIWNEMGNPERADNYAEVSDLKWLFRGHPKRTHQQARAFMQTAWDYIGYQN